MENDQVIQLESAPFYSSDYHNWIKKLINSTGKRAFLKFISSWLKAILAVVQQLLTAERNGLDAVLYSSINLHGSQHYNLIRQF